jgi:hypothetical protein
MIRVLALLILLCFGCQTGRIPCPKFKSPASGHHRKYRNFSASLTAKVEEKPDIKVKRSDDSRYVRNVSVEEWDCPQPGQKKYLPKNVKDNIRRNTKLIKEDLKEMPADTISLE